MKPSQYQANYSARAAEIEAAAGGHSAYADTFRAASYKQIALAFAALADAENRERRREQADARTISHALSIIETANANEISDSAIACLVDYLHAKIVDRNTPVAWAGKGLHMSHTVAELSQLLTAACHNDGIIIGNGMRREYDDELSTFDRAEARAINAGALA